MPRTHATVAQDDPSDEKHPAHAATAQARARHGPGLADRPFDDGHAHRIADREEHDGADKDRDERERSRSEHGEVCP